MLSEIKRGTKLRNAFNKETFVFSGPVDDPAVARFEVILEEGGSGGGNALLHVHPGADEHFAVKSGRIKIVVEGREQIVEGWRKRGCAARQAALLCQCRRRCGRVGDRIQTGAAAASLLREFRYAGRASDRVVFQQGRSEVFS